VYENREEARKVGLRGQATIREELNADVIGQLIVNRLKEIERSLNENTLSFLP